jgi:hypothetical protein
VTNGPLYPDASVGRRLGASNACSPTTTLPPPLLDVPAAARYLGVSIWALRDWHASGLIAAVDLPPLRPREGDRPKRRLRRLVFDIKDLDAFIDGLRRTR